MEKKNYILAPSILSADFWNLGKDIEETVDAGAKWIHFDVMDGHFVPNISFGIPVLKNIRAKTEAFLDVHLMISEPERYVEAFAHAGADIVTFHAEADCEIEKTIQMIHDAGAKAGIVIKPGTPAEAIFPYLGSVEMILVMSVEPGFGGQKFMPVSLEKIRLIREQANKVNPKLHIEVDGGIIFENAREILEAGADVLVAGSTVFNGNITENTKNLLEKMS